MHVYMYVYMLVHMLKHKSGRPGAITTKLGISLTYNLEKHCGVKTPHTLK